MDKFHFRRKYHRKESVTSPKCLGINTNALCMNLSSRQSTYHALVFQIAFSERASWHSVRLIAKAIIVSAWIIFEAAATNLDELTVTSYRGHLQKCGQSLVQSGQEHAE